MVVDQARAKSSGTSGPFDSMMGFGGSGTFGGMTKPKPRPQAQSFMGQDQPQSSWGGTNVLR